MLLLRGVGKSLLSEMFSTRVNTNAIFPNCYSGSWRATPWLTMVDVRNDSTVRFGHRKHANMRENRVDTSQLGALMGGQMPVPSGVTLATIFGFLPRGWLTGWASPGAEEGGRRRLVVCVVGLTHHTRQEAAEVATRRETGSRQ